MLNDFNRNDDFSTVYVAKTRQLLGEEAPFYVYKSSLGRDEDVVVFSDVFITHMRAVLSNVNGSAIVTMSKKEQELYFAYVDYVNEVPVEDDLQMVVEKLNLCITNELNCVTQTYINQAFNTTHEWETYPENKMYIETTQILYDLLIPQTHVTYAILDDGDKVKIYLDGEVIWQKT